MTMTKNKNKNYDKLEQLSEGHQKIVLKRRLCPNGCGSCWLFDNYDGGEGFAWLGEAGNFYADEWLRSFSDELGEALESESFSCTRCSFWLEADWLITAIPNWPELYE